MRKNAVIAATLVGLALLCAGLRAGTRADAPPSRPTTIRAGEVLTRVIAEPDPDPSHGLLPTPGVSGTADEGMVRALATFRGQRTIRCGVPFPPSTVPHLWFGLGWRVVSGPPSTNDQPVFGAWHGERAPDIAAQRSTADVWIRAGESDTDLLFAIDGVGLVRITAPAGFDPPVVSCTTVSVVAPEIEVHGTVVDLDGAARGGVRVQLPSGRLVAVDERGGWAARVPETNGVVVVYAPEGNYRLPYRAAAGETLELVTDPAASLPADTVAAEAAEGEVEDGRTATEAFLDLAKELLDGPDVDGDERDELKELLGDRD